MNNRRLARGLGWLSIGIGATEILAAGPIERILGLRGKRFVIRACGVREVVAGIGLLRAKGDRSWWLRFRIAGDMMDLAALVSGVSSPVARTGPLVAATALVSVLAVVDVLCERRETAIYACVDPGLGCAEETDARLHGESHDLSDDEKIDMTVFDSFPASDPPGRY